MKIRIFKSFEDRMKEYDNWERFFAIFPREIDGEIVFFQYIERKAMQSWYEKIWTYRFPVNKK